MLARTFALRLQLALSKVHLVTLSLILTPKLSYLVTPRSSDSFTIDNHYCPQLPKLVPYDTGISSIVFTPSLVRKSINHLRAKSKGGPDRIPPFFFKKCSFWLCQPLSYIFQFVAMPALCRLNGHKLTLPPSFRKVTLLTP
jgi:hypothetical protein